MLSFSQIWTSLPNDAYRPMLIDDTECNVVILHYDMIGEKGARAWPPSIFGEVLNIWEF